MSPNRNNGAQQQYTVISEPDKQQLLPNGLLDPINSFQKASKQCEVHHSVLHNHNHHLHHHHQAAQVAAGAGPSRVQHRKGDVNFCRAWLNKFPSRSKRIDVISRIFFPLMFALFNLVYWTTYLFREDEISERLNRKAAALADASRRQRDF